jgi:hypothetical protein
MIKDYPLFPGGRLQHGKSPLRKKVIPMHGSSIQDLLHDLEENAEVTHEKGRAWHGLRGAMTDLYPEATADARLLDVHGGWVPVQQPSLRLITERAVVAGAEAMVQRRLSRGKRRSFLRMAGSVDMGAEVNRGHGYREKM